MCHGYLDPLSSANRMWRVSGPMGSRTSHTTGAKAENPRRFKRISTTTVCKPLFCKGSLRVASWAVASIPWEVPGWSAELWDWQVLQTAVSHSGHPYSFDCKAFLVHCARWKQLKTKFACWIWSCWQQRAGTGPEWEPIESWQQQYRGNNQLGAWIALPPARNTPGQGLAHLFWQDCTHSCHRNAWPWGLHCLSQMQHDLILFSESQSHGGIPRLSSCPVATLRKQRIWR